ITIGDPTASIVSGQGTAPTQYWSGTQTSGGNIFFGSGIDTVSGNAALATNTANVSGGVLVFNGRAGAPNSIELNGNVQIAVNGQAPTFNNFDLSMTSAQAQQAGLSQTPAQTLYQAQIQGRLLGVQNGSNYQVLGIDSNTGAATSGGVSLLTIN